MSDIPTKTDEDVICEWMGWARGGHWRVGTKVPINVYLDDRPMFQCHDPEDAARIVAAMNKGTLLTLDRLHEVEARLTDAQWLSYQNDLNRLGDPNDLWCKRMIGATAANKIKALAAVIRAETK